MEYLVGLLLSLALMGLAISVGFDGDRAFYPTVLIVVGHYYVLFAAMGASGRTLQEEIAIASVFLAAAVLGYKKYPWLVVAGLAGHGVQDMFHHLFIDNPGVPRWWPGFCMAFDVFLAVWLVLWQGVGRKASPRPSSR